MARPREFDPEEVLNQVKEVFWEHGYDHTSFRDLEHATGLKKGSLFLAYGDKDDLYAAVLRRYSEQYLENLKRLCESRKPRKALEAWLSEVCRQTRRGRCCLVISSAVRVSKNAGTCRALVLHHCNRIEGALVALIHAGIKERQFRSSVRPKIAARQLLMLVSGLHALAKVRCLKKREISDFVSSAVATLL